MGIEIERKFLVHGTDWKNTDSQVRIRQGYLQIDPAVRIRQKGNRGYITIKGRGTNIQRPEFEYEIPLKDAVEMLNTLCPKPQIDKIRYHVQHADHLWEIDEFLGSNAKLVVAEIELTSPDEQFEKPSWVGKEVTHDPAYTNAQLSVRPYSTWSEL